MYRTGDCEPPHQAGRYRCGWWVSFCSPHERKLWVEMLLGQLLQAGFHFYPSSLLTSLCFPEEAGFLHYLLCSALWVLHAPACLAGQYLPQHIPSRLVLGKVEEHCGGGAAPDRAGGASSGVQGRSSEGGADASSHHAAGHLHVSIGGRNLKCGCADSPLFMFPEKCAHAYGSFHHLHAGSAIGICKLSISAQNPGCGTKIKIWR